MPALNGLRHILGTREIFAGSREGASNPPGHDLLSFLLTKIFYPWYCSASERNIHIFSGTQRGNFRFVKCVHCAVPLVANGAAGGILKQQTHGEETEG